MLKYIQYNRTVLTYVQMNNNYLSKSCRAIAYTLAREMNSKHSHVTAQVTPSMDNN
jgi:hypothetical protein